MSTECFLFIYHTISIWKKFSTWCFEDSGDSSFSLLVNSSHTNESLEGGNTHLWIYALNLFIGHSGENWWEQNIFGSFTAPQAFWPSSTPGALSTVVTSVVLCEWTRATLIIPGKDGTRVCGYMLWIYSLKTLENTDMNRIYFVRSGKDKSFVKAQHLVLLALWRYQLFSTH